MLKLFNTLSRTKQEFRPLHNNKVGMYTCGPTVYDFAHIGNLRAYLFADLLKRTISHDGYQVTHIMNITDVGHLTGDRDMGQDKVESAAAKAGKSAWEIASYYTEAFLDDIKKLNILPPDRMPKATDHIKEMIALIQKLAKNGFTYQTTDGIYFDTAKLADYGKLAKLDREGLQEGARVEPNPEKKNPTDFALWKFSHPRGGSFDSAQDDGAERRQMEWESPWGVGFPGWHIECSVMSTKYLDQPFDIHTGGIDLVPVHHINEIAQSEAAFAKPLAMFWLHNEHLLLGDARIGKSEGNQITLPDLLNEGYSALAYRYFVLGGHYRSRLNFSWQALESAQNSLNNLYATIAPSQKAKGNCPEFEQDFFAAINDDLDTPKALAIMWNMLRSNNPLEAKLSSLLEFDKILGLSIKTIWKELQKPLPPDVKNLVQKRERMRREQNWAGADALREQIGKLGYEIRDTDIDPLVKRKRDSY